MKPVRIQPGQPLSEVRNLLTERQKDELDHCRVVWDDTKRIEAYALERRNEAVKHALKAGIPARLLAAQLGITAGRVYQIRKGV
jgi:hypothetical protein